MLDRQPPRPLTEHNTFTDPPHAHRSPADGSRSQAGHPPCLTPQSCDAEGMPKNWSVPSVPSRVVLAIALDSHGHTVGSAFGTLAVGGPGDVSVFERVEGSVTFVDTTGHQRRGTVSPGPSPPSRQHGPALFPSPRPVPYPQPFSSPEPMCAGRRSPSTRRSPKHLPHGDVRRPTAHLNFRDARPTSVRVAVQWRGAMVRTSTPFYPS